MSCPFLREAYVRSCTAASVRKLIVRSALGAPAERCSTPTYLDCAVFKAQSVSGASDGECPLLEQKLAQYCGAASVTKFVPYSDQAGKCTSEAYRFCDLYLGMARPMGTQPRSQAQVHGLPVPADVWFAPNHMWLHIGSSGLCHIGVDWTMVFPNPMLVTSTNVYLRHRPDRVAVDPYGAAWIFEGWPVPQGTDCEQLCVGLMTGESAITWMESEVDRLNQHVHRMSGATLDGHAILNDGGAVTTGLAQQLTREELVRVFSDFFSADAGWESRK
jgi:hypothetical protein